MSRVRSTRRGAAATLVSAVAAASVAQAQTNTYDYRSHAELNSVIDEDAATAYLGPLVSSVSDPTGSSNGQADVGRGFNAAAALIRGTAAFNPVQTAGAGGSAAWSDVVTISRSNLNGTPGTFTARIRVNGSGSLTMSQTLWSDPDVFVTANWNATAIVNPGTAQEFGYSGAWFSAGNGFQYFGDPLNSYQQSFVANFVYGQPFSLSVALHTSFSFTNDLAQLVPGTFEGVLDFSDAAVWGGISAIRDSFGSLVTGATVSSQSGAMWLFEASANAARGDFNNDNRVNLADFNLLASRFGTSVTPWTLGDSNGDGLVNLSDFNALARNFGATFGPDAPTPEDWATLGNAVVPEPQALGVIGVTALALLRRRRPAHI